MVSGVHLEDEVVSGVHWDDEVVSRAHLEDDVVSGVHLEDEVVSGAHCEEDDEVDSEVDGVHQTCDDVDDEDEELEVVGAAEEEEEEEEGAGELELSPSRFCRPFAKLVPPSVLLSAWLASQTIKPPKFGSDAKEEYLLLMSSRDA